MKNNEKCPLSVAVVMVGGCVGLVFAYPLAMLAFACFAAWINHH